MESTNNEDYKETSSTEIFKIPGEPAIVINGLPALSSNDASMLPCAVTDSQSQKLVGFGELLVGREVRKLFGEQFFSGKVSQFDQEMGWYRVLYDDGDFEDLEWHELEEVLVPLDVNIPLETLVKRVMKKTEKSVK